MANTNNNRYSTIEELIAEVEALGDWKDESQRDAYFKILAKITVLYNGYTLRGREKYYPSEVIEAVCHVCSQKFPKKSVPFDEKGDLKPGFPEYSNYLVLATEPSLVSIMGERTNIDGIAHKEFGIDVYDTPATKAQVDSLVNSSKAYLEKVRTQQPT